MGKGKKRGNAPFFQSAMFKVQSSNVVSLRDGINYSLDRHGRDAPSR